MPGERRLILPPGVGVPPPADPESHAVVINETGLPDATIGDAAKDFFIEHASVGGVGRAPSTFGVYSANQGSMLARTEYQTPTNVIEEIRLARELAERDDDIGAVMQSMIALAYGEGMENFHEDERTVSIFNSIAVEMNLDRVLRDLYREYLISYQVNTVSLFTRTAIEYTMDGSDRLRSDVLAWPYVGVLPAENVRVLDNDMFGTGTLAYVPDDDRLRQWLDEYFDERTTPARKAEMGRQDRVSANMFTGVHQVNPSEITSDADLILSDGKLYLLNPRLVHRHTGPKGSWKYPRPLLTRNFALLEAKRLLNLMDFALLQGGANFIVVAKKGTDKQPAQPAELQNLTEVVRRSSRTGVIVGDHRLTFDVITPKLDELLNPEKRRLIGRKLARGLLRLPELDDENAEGTRLDAEFVARVIGNDRHELKRHVERTSYKETAKRNARRLSKGAPKLWHPRIILQGTQYFNDLVLKLRDRGDIPRKWAVEAGGFDFDAAVQERERERKAGVDETMAPAAVPFDSPNKGPQDNQPGRPANQPNGTDPAAPRRVIAKTAGETVTAMYSEELDRGVRIGENTYAILEEHADYTQGRVSRVEREVLDSGEEDPVQRATTIYVPVNPGHECSEYQAVNLRDGLRMIVGDRVSDRAKVAKLMVFREAEFDEAAAEATCIRWGFPVRMPELEPTPNSGPVFDADEFARRLGEQLAAPNNAIAEALKEIAHMAHDKAPKTKTTDTNGVFDITGLDEWEQGIIESVIAHSSFDFKRLIPGLRRETKRSTIKVVFKALGSNTNAQVTPEEGLLEVNTDMRPGGSMELPEATVVSYVTGEIAHFADAYLLSDEQRTEIAHAIGTLPEDEDVTVDDWFNGEYWSRPGESFMAVFILAFSDLRADQRHFKYSAGNKAVEVTRRALG